MQLPPGPPFFRFSDPVESERALRQAGFGDIRVATVPQVWRFQAPDGRFEVLFQAGVRIKAVLRAPSDEALQAIRATAREACGHYHQSGSVELAMPAILASAAKPA